MTQNAGVAWAYEAKGKVHPANFSYPLSTDPGSFNNLHLDRDVEVRGYHDSDYMISSPDVKDWSSLLPVGNDTSDVVFRQDQPNSLGFIYDVDNPTIEFYHQLDPYFWGNNEIRRYRFNGREFAWILAQGKQTRCSKISGFYIRFSAKQITDSTGSQKWIPVNDIPNDNQAAFGVTAITYDLKPAAPKSLTATSKGNQQITLNWLASDGATSYNVYQSSSAGSGFYSTANTSYDLINLQPGATYYFRVTGVNSNGEGLKSIEVNATSN